MPKSLKPATSPKQQIETLRSRGMQLDDSLAYQWLENVSYYRLSAYWYPARVFGTDGKRTDVVHKGTCFNDVVALYEADRKLRTLVHDGIERIEIMLRTRIGEQLVASGPLSYKDPRYFRPAFNHASWVSTANKRVKRAARTNEPIKKLIHKGFRRLTLAADPLARFASLTRRFTPRLAADSVPS